MKIFVTNISKEVSDEQLEALFAQYGAIKAARIVYDQITSNSRFGYVEMENEAEAREAAKTLNGQFWMETTIEIKIDDIFQDPKVQDALYKRKIDNQSQLKKIKELGVKAIEKADDLWEKAKEKADDLWEKDKEKSESNDETPKTQLNSNIYILLEEFSLLQDNWDNEGAKSPSKRTIRKTKRILNYLKKVGQSVYHAAPGPNGEIMLDLRNNSRDKSIEIISYNDRSVFVKFFNNENPSQGLIEESSLSMLIESLNE